MEVTVSFLHSDDVALIGKLGMGIRNDCVVRRYGTIVLRRAKAPRFYEIQVADFPHKKRRRKTEIACIHFAQRRDYTTMARTVRHYHGMQQQLASLVSHVYLVCCVSAACSCWTTTQLAVAGIAGRDSRQCGKFLIVTVISLDE